MLIRSKPGWEMPEGDATPESVFEDRRRLAKALAAGPLLLGAAPALSLAANAAEAETDPRSGLYPVKRNPRYELDREVTDERTIDFGTWSVSLDDAREAFFVWEKLL